MYIYRLTEWHKNTSPLFAKLDSSRISLNILNTVAKRCHTSSSEDTIYILMNACIDYFICVYECARV